jgi:glycerate 2-kinase
VDITSRRAVLRDLLDMAIAAVDPERLTNDNLTQPGVTESITLIAIGKASAAMCRGAVRRLGAVRGVCVTNAPDVVPEGVELIMGDHPIPGDRSFAAGHRVLEIAERAPDKIIALVSGGGSALCEYPIPGVSRQFIRETNEILVSSGASIAETNLVRRHLSAIKGGGLVRAAGRPIDTYLISDVCGADPLVVASGPTVPAPADPEAALSIMNTHGIDIPSSVKEAIRSIDDPPGEVGAIRVLADGHTAAAAAAQAARASGHPVLVLDGWVRGPLTTALREFMTRSGPGLTIATGEPDVAVGGDGRGGRNTHAALLAAEHLADTDDVFAAFATDGVDGNSSSAGAMVDGGTITRGGDPRSALESYDSATYLRATEDLIETGPTGTNVSDLWLLWR